MISGVLFHGIGSCPVRRKCPIALRISTVPAKADKTARATRGVRGSAKGSGSRRCSSTPANTAIRYTSGGGNRTAAASFLRVSIACTIGPEREGTDEAAFRVDATAQGGSAPPVLPRLASARRGGHLVARV